MLIKEIICDQGGPSDTKINEYESKEEILKKYSSPDRFIVFRLGGFTGTQRK